MGYKNSGSISYHIKKVTNFKRPAPKSRSGFKIFVDFVEFLDVLEQSQTLAPRSQNFLDYFRGTKSETSPAVTVEEAKAIVETTQPQLFDFDGHNVRVVMQDGEPWWVLKDVCEILGLETKHVQPRLNSEDTNKVANTDPNRGRGNPNLSIVNESGLYDVILDSRKPQAKQFRRWVTNEVLPSIRKDGGYVLGQENMTPEEFELQAMKFVKNKIESLEKQLEEARPQIEFANAVEASDKTITLTEMAKLIDSSVCPMNVTKLSQQLREEGYLFKRQVGGVTLPIRKYVEEGLFDVKETGYYDNFREEWIPQLQTRVTGKGQKFLIGKYSNCLV